MSGKPKLGAFLGGKCGRVSLGTPVPSRSKNPKTTPTSHGPCVCWDPCHNGTAAATPDRRHSPCSCDYECCDVRGMSTNVGGHRDIQVTVGGLFPNGNPPSGFAPPRHVCWEVKALPPLVFLDNSSSCVHMHGGEWARQLGRGVPGPRPAALRFLNRRGLGPHPCRPLQRAPPPLPHRAPHCRWGMW
jgi:hypothetical protein